MERGNGLLGSVFVALYGEGFFAFFLQHDVKAQTVVVQGRTQFEIHGGAFDGAGFFGIFPENIFFVAQRPEKPGQEPVGNFHAVAVIIKVFGNLFQHFGQFGGIVAPIGILQDIFQSYGLAYGGKAGFVLAGAVKFHGKPARFREKAEQEIMPAGFRFGGGGKEIAEALAPFRAYGGGLALRVVGNIDGSQGAQRQSRHMTAGTAERFHAVAFVFNVFVVQAYGYSRAVCLKIFAVHGAACLAVGIFHTPQQIAYAVFRYNHFPGIRNVFRYGLLNKMF